MKNKIIIQILILLIFPSISGAIQTCRNESEIPSSTLDLLYIDNGNGTITDINKGLMWHKCPLGYSGPDCLIKIGANKYNLQDALYEAENNLHGGYNDWRLPNIKELQSLVEIRCYEPAINLNLFPNTPGSIGSNFFSSSMSKVSIGYSHIVNFRYGRSMVALNTELNYVRFVRNNTSTYNLEISVEQEITQTDPTTTDLAKFEVIFSSEIINRK